MTFAMSLVPSIKYYLLVTIFYHCSASKLELDYHIIGIFSTCSSPETRNSTRTSEYQNHHFHESAFQTYLAFERTNAYYNQHYLHPYNKTIQTISIDVCGSQNLLVKVFLDLFLDGNLFYEEVNGNSKLQKQPRYLIVYSYMTEHLTWLASKLFQIKGNKIPFVILNTKGAQILDLEDYLTDLLNLNRVHQVRSEYETAYRTKSFFDRFEWKSIAILTLSQDNIYQRRTNLLYKALEKDPTYCVYKMDNLTSDKPLERTIVLLQNRTDLQVIYAMGEQSRTLQFLKTLDQFGVYNRVIFLDAASKSWGVPTALAKGLFYITNFGLSEDIKDIPNDFNYNYSTKTSFNIGHHPNQFDKNMPNIQVNPSTVKYNNETLKYALYETYTLLNRMYQYKIDLTTTQTAGYLNLNFLVNLKSLVLINLKNKYVENRHSLDGLNSDVTWPGNLSKPPEIACENQHTIPPGYYQSFGTVPWNRRKWDHEISWFVTKCKEGFYKNSYGNSCCKKCPNFTKSNAPRTDCYSPYTDLTPVNFTNIEGIMLCITLIVGVFTSLLYFTCYVYHKNTPVAKSSQLTLTVGQLIIHCFLFVVLLLDCSSPNSGISCWFPALLIGPLSTLLSSITLVKTQIVIWIFGSSTHFSRGEKHKQTTTLIMVVIAITSISILVSSVFLMLDKPQKMILYDHKQLTKFYYCNIEDQLHVQLVYTMFLSIFCVVQGVRTRRLPESFKSTRYIIYAMYTNIVIQTVFVTLFNAQRKEKYLQTYVLLFTLALSNLSILLIMHTQRVINLLNYKKNNAMAVQQQISSCITKQNASLKIRGLPSN